MPTNLHRCPQCTTVGKVNRSKPRGFGEKLRLRLVPVYGVYRCHNCNWRGWLVRSTASPLRTALFVIGYILVALCVVGVIGYFIAQNWPRPDYQY
jgi:hypothetical protein